MPAQKPAWDARCNLCRLPFYFDWHFNTGERQDFGALPRILMGSASDRWTVRSPGSYGGRETGCAGQSPSVFAAAPPVQGLKAH
jgi:hypothetical protein